MTEAEPLGAVASLSAARAQRQRRARSSIPGVRAETVPPPRAGEVVFRLVPDSATLRVWGRRHGFEVSGRGPVRKEVRDHFDQWNAWTVRIVSMQPPGYNRPRQFFKIMQGPYLHKMTRDPYYVKRVLGEDLFALLKETRP